MKSSCGDLPSYMAELESVVTNNQFMYQRFIFTPKTSKISPKTGVFLFCFYCDC